MHQQMIKHHFKSTQALCATLHKALALASHLLTLIIESVDFWNFRNDLRIIWNVQFWAHLSLSLCDLLLPWKNSLQFWYITLWSPTNLTPFLYLRRPGENRKHWAISLVTVSSYWILESRFVPILNPSHSYLAPLKMDL